MISWRCLVIYTLVILGLSNVSTAQIGRLENEFKISVPEEDLEAVWEYVTTNFAKSNYNYGLHVLSGTTSIETFIDTYYDTPDYLFVTEEVSLRHRKRYKDKLLLKQLIQYKIPHSDDKLTRIEMKFPVVKNENQNKLASRHSFLKHLSNASKQKIEYQLARYRVKPKALQESLTLYQVRQRVYISDQQQESIATITLDEVKNSAFPFQKFVELELELNEIRYTNATIEEKQLMDKLNADIKEALFSNFPSLALDQRSKYNKMRALMDSSALTFSHDKIAWFLYGLIALLASYFWIREQIAL